MLCNFDSSSIDAIRADAYAIMLPVRLLMSARQSTHFVPRLHTGLVNPMLITWQGAWQAQHAQPQAPPPRYMPQKAVAMMTICGLWLTCSLITAGAARAILPWQPTVVRYCCAIGTCGPHGVLMISPIAITGNLGHDHVHETAEAVSNSYSICCQL